MYPDSPLANAVKDAEIMKEILGGKGVIIIDIKDCSAKQFKKKQKKYVKLLKKGDLALFFFAGHACVFNNCPRLLTIPEPGSKLHVERDSINVYRLLSRWAESCTSIYDSAELTGCFGTGSGRKRPATICSFWTVADSSCPEVQPRACKILGTTQKIRSFTSRVGQTRQRPTVLGETVLTPQLT